MPVFPMHLTEPTFPPLLNGIAVRGRPRPFELARAKAAAGVAEAGDVFWSRDTSRLDCAIVLEPEVETPRALHMLLTAMVAFGDALGAIAPPEVGVFYRWPAEILVNGARAGRLRVALPDDAREDSVPRWLVVGIEVDILADEKGPEPGFDADSTTLHAEGCEEIDRTRLVESFCRHFLVWVHTWNEDGFRPVHEAWLQRADGLNEEITVAHDGETLTGRFLGLDEAGNLLLKRGEGVTMLPLMEVAERGMAKAEGA